MIKAWVEAMRLRTLPVSVAGVIGATGFCLGYGGLLWLPALLCLLFAVLAQIASNFANEYYDFKGGLDRAGRAGPRRGVTEGDISPRSMLAASFLTLGLACCVGLMLVLWGGWWLIPIGLLIALGVLAYSTGPYPLSHHGLGEVAVVFFFGIIPVNLTFYLAHGGWVWMVFAGSVGYGLMGANVLLVNNYRDYHDDRAVGKKTLAVKFGRRSALYLYLANGIAAAILAGISAMDLTPCIWIIAGAYLLIHLTLWDRMRCLEGEALNPLLGMTACLMLLTALASAVTMAA